MSKHLRKIKCKRRYFVRYFVVSLVLMILACLLVMCCKNGLYNMALHYYKMTYKEFLFHILGFMSLWKILIIQFALAPAIAFFWLEKHKEYIEDEEDGYEMRRM